MRVLIAVILIIISSGYFSYGKNQKTDSLINVLNNDISDAERVFTFIRIVTELRSNDIDSALYFAKNALKLSLKTREDTLIAPSYESMAAVYYFLSDYDKAEEYYKKSIKLYKKSDDLSGLAAAYTNIGSLYDGMENYNLALEYHFKSLDLFIKINAINDVSKAYNNIGLINFRISNYDKALEYYNKALDIRVELNDTLGLALIYNNIGILYYYEEEYEKVLEYFKKALKIWEESNNKRQTTLVLYNLGELYYELSLYESALNYSKEAYLIDLELKDQYSIVGDRTLMGKIYLEMKNYPLAKEEFYEALYLAKKLNVKSEIISIYESLSAYYMQINDYKTSLDYFKKYHFLNDSVFSVQKNEIVTEMQTKYETEKKEQKIELLHNKNKLSESELNKQRIITIFLFVGIFFILTVAFIVTLLIRKRSIERKRANTALTLKNTEILQQKEEIEAQRDEIEKQRDIATNQRDLITKQKEAITDSIVYAERIQMAILPPEKTLNELLKNYFIFFQPKDVVSGDFYWTVKMNRYILFTVADCTGHGVPGAFMSMLGISYLNEIVKKSEVYNTGLVLDQLRDNIIDSLQQKDIYNEDIDNLSNIQNVQDGMDISFCALDIETNILQFSCANNSLYLIREKGKAEIEITDKVKILENDSYVLYEFKPDKMPIAIYKRMDNFTTKEIQLLKNDAIYLFTDGFADQFGNAGNSRITKDGGIKFKYKPFKKLLLDIVEKPVNEQKEILTETFINWKGDFDQIDDILIFGLKI